MRKIFSDTENRRLKKSALALQFP